MNMHNVVCPNPNPCKNTMVRKQTLTDYIITFVLLLANFNSRLYLCINPTTEIDIDLTFMVPPISRGKTLF